LFTVQAQNLRKYLNKHYRQVSKKMDVEVQALLNQYFHSLNSINNKGEPISKEFLVDPLIIRKDFQLEQLNAIHRKSTPRLSPDGH